MATDANHKTHLGEQSISWSMEMKSVMSDAVLLASAKAERGSAIGYKYSSTGHLVHIRRRNSVWLK